ncbi:hypothetical protein [Oceanivirga miroungae]|uniref:Uncharacterized protein n=1 Tax=Oceanivirga miroungae TaxID=1130046 RepID=A0A6I8MCT4_9FUSO|nr:hypothetical protein [Oceanivirga miroungae]VWL84940.1 hypothetical protein OMES3154_00213 [Oceanivirga miroungae]
MYNDSNTDEDSKIWIGVREYLTLLEEIDEKFNENLEQIISKENKLRYDNIALTYFGVYYVNQVREYYKNIDEADEIIQKKFKAYS